MRVFSRKFIAALGLFTLTAAGAVLITILALNSAPDIDSSGFPECDDSSSRDYNSPCAVLEDGEIFIKWDRMTFKPGLAPTPYPVPYRAQSLHPDILARAESEGVVLDISDYDEVFVGIIHNHYPLECDGHTSCSEHFLHRFNGGDYSSQFNPDRNGIQSLGINYVEVGGVIYLDGLDQLPKPITVPATPTIIPSR